MPSVRCLLAAASLLAAAAPALAGPITPPGGPVAPSMKTLDQVEPRRPIRAADIPLIISQPGNYYLTENITTATTEAAIRISASDVTIDLGGFTLRGPGGTPTGLRDGIRLQSSHSGIWIRNGTIAGFQGRGIDMSLAAANVRISDVCVTACGGMGARVGSAGAVVERCTASANGQSGLSGAGQAVAFIDCTAVANGDAGFVLGGAACTARGCSAVQNTSDGFRAPTGFTEISGCKAYDNGGDGFVVTNAGATIRECVALNNGGDGIEAWGNTRIIDNHCRSNGITAAEGAGIRLAGSWSHVEANTLSGNDVGIRAMSSGNMIVRNVLASHAGGHIVASAGNNVAQILSSPGGSFTATNPWANLSH